MVVGVDYEAVTEFAEMYFPKSEYLSKIVGDMPEKMRSGSVIIDEGDLKLYLSVWILSIIFFFCLFAFFQFILRKFFYGEEEFANLTNDE